MKYELETNIHDKGVIEQILYLKHENTETQMTRWLADTREGEFREALISIGWTPPKEDNNG